MKKLLNLKGAQQLSKTKQQAIGGGGLLPATACGCDGPTPPGYCCCQTDNCRMEFIPIPVPDPNKCW